MFRYTICLLAALVVLAACASPDPVPPSPTQTPAAAVTTADSDRVEAISPPGESYVDPEILPGGSLITYQSEGGIYLAPLDPATGRLESPGILVDTGAARLLATFNGPEFGIDAHGWALYYAKPHAGEVQIWRATLDDSGQPQAEPLTAGSRFQTQLVSRNPDADTTHIAAIEGTWQQGTAVWFDEAEPDVIYPIDSIENGVIPLRWVDGSSLITLSERTGPARGQLSLLDTDTNTTWQITDDDGDKTDPYGWFAPEFGGDLLVLAIVDNESVAIYRDTGGAMWERIATLTPPPEARFDFVASAEPFTVGGRSYLSLVVKDANSSRQAFSDSEVWLFDINDDPQGRYAERCDSGEPGIARSDPEVFIGTGHVFVYYNVIGGDNAAEPYAVRRCRSGIMVDGTAQQPPSMPPDAQPPASSDACQWIDPAEADAAVSTAFDPHYVCHDPDAAATDGLLVFLPGTGAAPADYELFVQEAAAVGLHAIGLSYVNPRSVNLQICPDDTDPDCHADVRREVIDGQDRHPGVDVGPADSITSRLVALLRYLDDRQPDAGWDAYLAGDQPAWDQIVVSGHSQGAGMAAMLAHDNEVGRAVLFAWVDQRRGLLAPWLQEPFATPAERIFYFEHVADRERGEVAKLNMFTALGINAFGEATVDESEPPYGGAHILLTALDPARTGARASAGAHNMVVGDDYTPMEGGMPVLRDVWRYLLTAR